MAIININPLIDAVGGNTATGATGTVTAVAHAGGLPASRIQGAGVILPEPVKIAFTDGVLAETLDLDVLPEGYYWKFTICVDDICRTDYFVIPAEATYDYNELDFIDPVAYQELIPAFPNPVSYAPNIVNLTGETVTGSYIKFGKMVYVAINVALTNVSNFGTGQYSFALPFASAYHQDVFAGSVHDQGTPVDHWSLKCHLGEGSTTATIWYLTRAGGDAVLDAVFDYNSPITLSTADQFHLAFWYEAGE